MQQYSYDASTTALVIETPLATKAQLLLVAGDEIDEVTDDEAASFIMTAHVMVCTYLDGYGIPTVLLTEIEKYLSAHFGTLAFPAVQREGLAVMTNSFATKLGLGLQNTRYGQSAIALDPTGNLKKLSDGEKSISVSITSLGSGRIYTQT